MKGRIAYLCLQATTEGQASHAHVHEICNGLQSLGWSVELYEPSYAGAAAPGPFGRLVEFSRIQHRLIARLRSYDVVYIRAHQLAYRTAFAAHRAGVPVIQECNGTFADLVAAWPATAPVAGLLARVQRRQYRLARAIIAVTPGLARWVQAESGNPNTCVVPNGANVDLFDPNAPRLPGLPEKYVVFFGALTPWAGVKTLLAAARSPKWPSDTALVVAGAGALSPVLETEAAQNPRVIALGSRPYVEMGGIVAGASASIVPTDPSVRPDADPSPVKLYESMAAGTPPIVSDTLSQAREVLEAGVGVTFVTADAESLASTVASLLSDPLETQEMGRRGRVLAVAEHSWSIRALRTSEIIERSL